MKSKIKRVFFQAVFVAISVSMIFDGALQFGYADVSVLTGVDAELTAALETENGENAQEAEKQPQKIDITNFTVELDKYMVMARGTDVTPKILSVSGEFVETTAEGEENEAAVQAVNFTADEYEVKYYRVESFTDEIFEEIDEIIDVGEYKIAVTAKDTEKFAGEASCLFSIVGRAQHLTVPKTKYSLKLTSKSPQIKPETDGDGTGFEFTSSDTEVLTVDKDGRVNLQSSGRAYVYVSTVGDKLSQPAKVSILFEISPAKVSWNSAKMKTRKNAATMIWKKQDGVTRYEIMYSTSKNFKASKKNTVKTITRKGTTTKAKLKLKKGNTYYVKIRAVTESVDTRGNQRTLTGAWSTVRKIEMQ